MGYYTYYKLSYEISQDSPASLETELIDAMSEESSCAYGKISNFTTGDADSCKWYEYIDDMKTLSARFPTVLFTLEGEGEESGDLWVAYFKGGKSQTCIARIEFDPYDESKLE